MTGRSTHLHYYVYFSSVGYIYKVASLAFNRKSDIKNEYYKEYYKGVKFYSTREKAQRAADKFNEKIKNSGELKLARSLYDFSMSLWEIEQQENISDQRVREIVRGLREMVKANASLIADTVKPEKNTNKSNV